jgi:uncharacterized membrane protein YgdD (TMEM256/DUF423 family)
MLGFDTRSSLYSRLQRVGRYPERVNRTWVLSGSFFAFLGVALGALGAHALKERLGENHTVWETAVQFQCMHALALLFLGLAGASMPAKSVKWIGALFAAGIVLFSGSLYVLALTEIKKLGAITPLGGASFLVAWVILMVAAARVKTIQEPAG